MKKDEIKFKEIVGKVGLETKIGKYHYLYSFAPFPVMSEKGKELYYTLYAMNLDNVTIAPVTIEIPFKVVLGAGKYGFEKVLNKYKNQLKRKILKCQKK